MKTSTKKKFGQVRLIEFKKVIIFGGFTAFLGLLVGLVYGGYLPSIFISF